MPLFQNKFNDSFKIVRRKILNDNLPLAARLAVHLHLCSEGSLQLFFNGMNPRSVMTSLRPFFERTLRSTLRTVTPPDRIFS